MLRLLQKFSGLLLLLISVHVYSRQITDTTITVYFMTGKYILTRREEQKLTNFFMQKSRATMIRIAGHTDTVGSESANMTLSRKRSEGVAAWIKKNVGIENIRLEY
ncbi:MAG TPA: OmpA family protein, partial [Puia sp.]|nr:OmpA family protein [Puia sp.]